MKRLILTTIIILTFGLTAHAANWNLDNAHSSIGFSVRHMVISKTTGKFSDYSGTVDFDGKNLDKASIDITISMASINTEDEDRDKHLKGPDFLDAAKFPEMTFKSSKITAGTDSEFKITGMLTIKGVSKEVTLEAEFNGIIDDPWGNTRAGFTAETTIDRQDFNVSFDNKLKDGSLIVGNDIKIMLEIELVKAK
ncbi:MAG: polyisoprenoid-binding protein [candidate division Zixibacteria bacterium]|nr:polyisoprenoid-binding protein [candidate division Zixibacteria bacterium]